MIDLTDEVRRSLREIAETGQPILLGDKAIRAVQRRRRWQRVSVLTSAFAVLAVMLPLWLTSPSSQGPVSPSASVPASPSATPVVASHVVSAYADSAGVWHILNPETGEYFASPAGTNAVSLSADLRTAAVLTNGQVGIVDTTGNTATAWARLPIATEYTHVSINSDGSKIAIPLWSGVVAGEKVFRDFAIVRTKDLQLTVSEFPQSIYTEVTGLSWNDDNLLATMFSARSPLYEGNVPGVHALTYATVDPETMRQIDYVGFPYREGPEYPWEHRIVEGNMAIVQATWKGQVLFSTSRLSGSSILLGPIPLQGPTENARAIGWEWRTGTILVQRKGAAGLEMVAVIPRTSQQKPVAAIIPPDAVNLVLGDGDALQPAAAARRWTL